MRIVEIYRSIQGEGLLTGVPSIFVRTSGCNLRCWFCDTPYASWKPEGDDLSVDEIVAQVDAIEGSHVVLTGGEPMIYAELVPLARALHERGYHLTIETAGTLYLPIHCDLMSISPKLANSAPAADEHPRWHDRHERSRHVPEVIRRLVGQYGYQFKFVVDRPEDCTDVERYLADFPEIDRRLAMLMPQGIDRDDLAAKEAWLAPYCQQHGLRYCPRRHIEWFGPGRGR